MKTNPDCTLLISTKRLVSDHENNGATAARHDTQSPFDPLFPQALLRKTPCRTVCVRRDHKTEAKKSHCDFMAPKSSAFRGNHNGVLKPHAGGGTLFVSTKKPPVFWSLKIVAIFRAHPAYFGGAGIWMSECTPRIYLSCLWDCPVF